MNALIKVEGEESNLSRLQYHATFQNANDDESPSDFKEAET